MRVFANTLLVSLCDIEVSAHSHWVKCSQESNVNLKFLVKIQSPNIATGQSGCFLQFWAGFGHFWEYLTTTYVDSFISSNLKIWILKIFHVCSLRAVNEVFSQILNPLLTVVVVHLRSTLRLCDVYLSFLWKVVYHNFSIIIFHFGMNTPISNFKALIRESISENFGWLLSPSI